MSKDTSAKKFIFLSLVLCIGTIVCGEEKPAGLPDNGAIGVPVVTIPTAVRPIKGVFIPKDPMIAGLLSVELPGLGQVYCRRYLRGITFFSSEIGCFVLAGTIIGFETKTYSWPATNETTGEKQLTQNVTISKWDDLSGVGRGAAVGLILGGNRLVCLECNGCLQSCTGT